MPTTKRHVLNAACYAEMLAKLVAGPCAMTELVDITGLHVNTVRKIIAALRLRALVHIVAWDIDHRGTRRVPVYAFGPGEDAPRPAVASKTLIQRRYRERVKKGLVRKRGSAVASVFDLGARSA